MAPLRPRKLTAPVSPAGLVLVHLLLVAAASTATAQSVCLPAPRLLTMMPMGGQAGTQVELAITGEALEDVEQLLFSDPRITAQAKLGSDGKPEESRFVVTIAADCPAGIHEARVWSRLGVSTARVFSVGGLPEVKQEQPATTVATAMPLAVNSICNATLTAKAVNHYVFEARQGERLLVDCAAQGIESKMRPVLILADAAGRDLVVERRGGALDYTVPADGRYLIKVHELTFQGGPEFFYRLALQKVEASAPLTRLPGTRAVSAFSWPPTGLAPHAAARETEPNQAPQTAQQITLPCDIAGSFFPAADVDVYEFTGRKGDVWWVEVASERLGRPTDPALVVQRVVGTGAQEQLTDVVELHDILSPVKRSSNGYAYDGPPYNAGSTDILGKLVIPEDGTYRLQLSDLFGGTRNDPQNEYRLILRQAAPDFALVAWALHMELRNGDRNALSKPLALRGGATMALEVVAVRRDGFEGEIELSLENLPDGVSAAGLKIPAGESRGIMLVTAHADAPRGLSQARFVGRGQIDGQQVERPCQLASLAWPIRDSWSEIPSPRLLAQTWVSVGGSELAPLSLVPTQAVVEAKVGETLKIPLQHIRRCDLSGASLALRAFGCGFDRATGFEVPLQADQSEAVISLAQLKTVPGEYRLAFYGSAVAKYRYNPQAVAAAELAHQLAQQAAAAAGEEAARLAQEASSASPDQKPVAEQASAAAAEKKKVAEAAVAAAAQRLQELTAKAQPTDIVDIVVSEPITLRVQPAEAP